MLGTLSKVTTILSLCLTFCLCSMNVATAGAWGHGSFENDDALDWTEELLVARDIGVILIAFTAVENSSTYIDAPDASSAVAAAEVVAAMLGKPSSDMPARLKAWLETHRTSIPPELAVRARRIIVTVQGTSSELNGLWSDSASYAAWRATLEDLSNRLAAR